MPQIIETKYHKSLKQNTTNLWIDYIELNYFRKNVDILIKFGI